MLIGKVDEIQMLNKVILKQNYATKILKFIIGTLKIMRT
jgi:hypothetical protein